MLARRLVWLSLIPLKLKGRNEDCFSGYTSKMTWIADLKMLVNSVSFFAFYLLLLVKTLKKETQ